MKEKFQNIFQIFFEKVGNFRNFQKYLVGVFNFFGLGNFEIFDFFKKNLEKNMDFSFEIFLYFEIFIFQKYFLLCRSEISPGIQKSYLEKRPSTLNMRKLAN